MKDERKQFLFDVFVTALEGGIGYWSHAKSYHWAHCKDGKPIKDDVEGFYAVVIDSEAVYDPEDAYFEETKIDRGVVQTGICRIVNGCVKQKDGTSKILQIASDIRKRICEASGENDAGIIDAGDADCIIQVGLFGEIVFG